jgi:RNA polymerase sigma-70 factor (ECF subfamily)
MALVRQGHSDALDEVTRCYSQRLLEAGRRHCRTTTEAEDAVQDALITAGEHLGELRNDSSLEGWLVKVVASACRRIGRGAKNAPSLTEPGTSLDDRQSPEDDPETQAARHELAHILDGALLALDPDERSLLLLAEIEGFSAAEIGAQLGLTDGAVRTRLSRLRSRLALALRQKLDGSS